MAFTAQSLRVHTNEGYFGASPTGALAFRDATYVTTDTAATVETTGYFNAAAARLQYGTVIRAIMAYDTAATTAPVFKNYIVTQNTGTVVTIALQTTATG